MTKLTPWYEVIKPRDEVKKGRSFNPDEFAIHLEQVVAGSAPLDYRDATQFFSRTVFTRALKDHLGMVLRRMAGKTEDTAPVFTLVTQFGGGKTHTLTAIYHMAKSPAACERDEGVRRLLFESGVSRIPEAAVAVLVGNAWDPKPGRETVWMDIAHQLAGERGIAALGPEARNAPPGTEALQEVFRLAGKPVVILFDEVLNLINRHRDTQGAKFAEHFHAFIQNLVVAMTGTTNCVAMISLPRSQVEMTEHDERWQEKITKVVKRVAKDLIANDEGEIAEVVRRRLFDEIDPRKKNDVEETAKAYTEWCFKNKDRLPPEWTSGDATIEAKAKDYLRSRFIACYPFHPATLTVFQRKWQALPQYQQTRGTLAMLAQWVSQVYREGWEDARTEPLIHLGSAPLHVQTFKATVLGQLGEPRLDGAIVADVTAENSHAKTLDADKKNELQYIHKRVGTVIFFESSGGMREKVARLPEIRFAVGTPDLSTTTIESAAAQLESRAYYLRKHGKDGYRFGFKPTLRKVVGDRRASLDEEKEVKATEREAVKKEFQKGATIPVIFFPSDASAIGDPTKLTLVLMDPDRPFTPSARRDLSEWTRFRSKDNPRLHPGALVWCLKKEGRELRDKVEDLLAWQQVKKEVRSGELKGEFEDADLEGIDAEIRRADEAMREEVWAAYRHVLVYDPGESDKVFAIDLGAGHMSAKETLVGRALSALISEGRLNETAGVQLLVRSWPPAFKHQGAWPLSELRKAFLDGSLTRVIDTDKSLRDAIQKGVAGGDLGLASMAGGTPTHVWYKSDVGPEEITFEAGLVLLTKAKATELQSPPPTPPTPPPAPPEPGRTGTEGKGGDGAPQPPIAAVETIVLQTDGPIPVEAWNRLGNKLVPTLKRGKNIDLRAVASVEVSEADRAELERELKRIFQDLGLIGWKIESRKKDDA